MKKLGLFLLGLMIVAGSTTSLALAAKKYRGNWGGNRTTSLEIKSVKPLVVHYCFMNSCETHEPRGTVNSMTIKYPRRDNFNGATLTFKKRGDVYNGKYKVRGSTEVFRATLK